MIESVVVFHHGGVVLWRKDYRHLEASPVNVFVRQVLINQASQGSGNVFNSPDGKYWCKHLLDNANKLTFLLVASSHFSLPYDVNDLLILFKSRFLSQFSVAGKVDHWGRFDAFTESFEDLFSKLQKKAQTEKLTAGPKAFSDTDKGKNATQKRLTKAEKKRLKKERSGTAEPVVEKAPVEEPTEEGATEEAGETTGEEKPAVRFVMKGGKRVLVRGSKGKGKGKAKKAGESPKKRGKGKIYRDPFGDDGLPVEDLGVTVGESTVKKENVGSFNLEDDDYESSDDELDAFAEELEEQRTRAAEVAAAKAGGGKKRGFFSKWLPALTGRTLTEEDLVDVMEEFANHLKSKNVSSDVSEQLCSSVSDSLVGKNLASFTSPKTVVKDAMKSALERILTPKREIDVLKEIAEVRKQGRPFTIVFVGVNGVGKSTSLSKITAWLMQNDLKVMIAACDTFRSGAVEQLKVHCDRLGVSLYQQGYGKDASHIAANAIKQANSEGYDVVLVDTAGRMQDNEPLMKALSTLVHYNNPDLVFFVGEALVGNDGVHQLVTFNRSLETLAASTHPGSLRKKATVIDGIVLTKFDTIDDKVGAAVSMVYTTGIPVVFVGVGQHYTDLKKMNVDTVVRHLIS